jgi:hypothetical protein
MSHAAIREVVSGASLSLDKDRRAMSGLVVRSEKDEYGLVRNVARQG